MNTGLFEFRDVSVLNADGSTRVAGLDAVIPDHGVTVVAGPSGSGKSTLLRLCNRLESADTGTVVYRGQPIEDTDPLRLRREVAMVFQRAIALPGSVADNLRYGVPDATPGEVSAMLGRVGLHGFERRNARELSGGEIQRMAFARALLTQPRYVLFDEPTSSLDPASTSAIEELVIALAREGTPSTWVTHDLDQMRRMAHHLIVVIDGAVAQQGHLSEVLAAPDEQVQMFLEGQASLEGEIPDSHDDRNGPGRDGSDSVPREQER